jgi:LPS sulfotransferase NodH
MDTTDTPQPDAAWPLGRGYADPLNDQPDFEGEPRICIIACSQRCGSTLLGDLLGRTGRLGVPAEYLNRALAMTMAARFGLLRPGDAVPIDPYLRMLFRKRTSPEGFFALKLQWHQYQDSIASKELARLLRSGRFIWLQREDVLGQAISSALAHASGRWHERRESGRQPPPVRYNHRLVNLSLRWVLWENWNWARFFEVNGIEPLAVTYEQLVADTDGVCRRICGHLGLADPPRFTLGQSATRPTRDTRSAEWRQRFLATLQCRPT